MWSRASHPWHPSTTPQQMRISPAHSSWRVSRKQERQQERALDHRFVTREVQQMSISFLLSDIFGYCALGLSERVVALAVFPQLTFQAPPPNSIFWDGILQKVPEVHWPLHSMNSQHLRSILAPSWLLCLGNNQNQLFTPSSECT